MTAKDRKAPEDARSSGLQELDDNSADKVSAGGEFDNMPSVMEHSYDSKDRTRY